MNIRKLPIGVQSFEKLRNENFLYVDKTDFIYRLATEGRQYFLSRPRRFGKSLLLSTMRTYFEGKKELFTGLKISELEKNWIKYPVFYFDFNGSKYTSSLELESVLNEHLSKWEGIYGSNPEIPKENLPRRFNYLLGAAHKKTGLGVVVLVDEYDKSLLESEGKALEESRKLFKGFFGNLKSCDEHLKFTFITGVTHFSGWQGCHLFSFKDDKLSSFAKQNLGKQKLQGGNFCDIFSDLNQLFDISLDKKYSTICGITQEEMEETFVPEITGLAEELSLSYEECLAELKRMYDGYHFNPNGEGLYNPFSLINAFATKSLENFWFSTGTPSFLINKLRQNNFDVRYLSTDELSATQLTLQDYRDDNPNPIPLFYQTGYLTIKGYDGKYKEYQLGYPNDEVRYSFLECLVPYFTHATQDSASLCVDEFCEDVQNGELDSFMTRFKSLFARLPYSRKTNDTVIEQNFQNVIYIVFILMGQFVDVEQHYSQGRADCVVQADNFIYIFEFKRDKSADEALRQIEEKQYAAPFASDNRKIFKVGVNFSSRKKNITEWKVVE